MTAQRPLIEEAVHLRTLRILHGYSAQDVANLTNGIVSRAVIANLESGRKAYLTVPELLALCNALDCAITDLRPSLFDYLPDVDTAAEQRAIGLLAKAITLSISAVTS